MKQSLDHLPIPCIRYFGHPMAAAVDAAPILREWEETLAVPFVVSFRMVLMSDLVKYFLFWKAKRGPSPVGCSGR